MHRQGARHGFANIALGTLGVLSLFWDKFRKPACFGIGLYIAGAAILHFMRIELMTVDEWATLLSDVSLVVIAVFGFFQKEKADKKK